MPADESRVDRDFSIRGGGRRGRDGAADRRRHLGAVRRAARARTGARDTLAANTRLQAMAAGSPALAMLIRADGRIELPRRLADALGLDDIPRDLSELSSDTAGLMPEDAAALSGQVTAAPEGGAGVQPLRPRARIGARAARARRSRARGDQRAGRRAAVVPRHHREP
ncbi:MAG: hypothetical protein WDN44_04590 [Sphingomonas sp.]